MGITRVVEFLPKESPPALTLSGPITVKVLDDRVLEDDENFICEITNVSHPRMIVGIRGEALITILDDDGEQHCEELGQPATKCLSCMVCNQMKV